MTVIVPASARHIAKYRQEQPVLLEESPHDYATITLPYIRENKGVNDLQVNSYF